MSFHCYTAPGTVAVVKLATATAPPADMAQLWHLFFTTWIAQQAKWLASCFHYCWHRQSAQDVAAISAQGRVQHNIAVQLTPHDPICIMTTGRTTGGPPRGGLSPTQPDSRRDSIETGV